MPPHTILARMPIDRSASPRGMCAAFEALLTRAPAGLPPGTRILLFDDQHKGEGRAFPPVLVALAPGDGPLTLRRCSDGEVEVEGSKGTIPSIPALPVLRRQPDSVPPPPRRRAFAILLPNTSAYLAALADHCRRADSSIFRADVAFLHPRVMTDEVRAKIQPDQHCFIVGGSVDPSFADRLRRLYSDATVIEFQPQEHR